MAKTQPLKTNSTKQLQPRTPPPLKAFLRLLADPEQDAAIKRILNKYSDPEQQHKFLRALQDAKFSYQLHATLSKQVSRSRKWFAKRDRWSNRIGAAEKQLTALLKDFQGTIYLLLRASNSLPTGYSQEISQVFHAIEHLQESIKKSAILSATFTKRGHQPQPYLKTAATALSRLKIAGADANELLSLIGVKPDPFA